ncbi:MAG: tRNA pseudouridine(38-40) synthase TruA [Flavicella sp.]
MRYFIELAYKGTNYHGWQIQPDAISVQEKVNLAFSKILNTTIQTVAAGRTDTGVHASQMFVHVDTLIRIDRHEYIYKLNAVLPNDIVIYNISEVNEEAHARFNATSRSYEYSIYLGRNPFLLDTTWQLYRQQLDIPLMNKAASLLLEYSDFQCFSKSKTDVKTFNCTITEAKWVLDGKHLTFHITADRFLRNMVRAIVGTLVEIGRGKKSIEELKEIIASKNRSNAGTSAPAQGLSLTAVTYSENINNGRN